MVNILYNTVNICTWTQGRLCHSLRAEALGSLACLCPCQQHPFSQDFTDSQHLCCSRSELMCVCHYDQVKQIFKKLFFIFYSTSITIVYIIYNDCTLLLFRSKFLKCDLASIAGILCKSVGSISNHQISHRNLSFANLNRAVLLRAYLTLF